MIQQKAQEPMVINWGKEQGPFVHIPLCFTKSSGIRRREGVPHMRILGPALGKKNRGEINLKYSVCQGAIPEPHQLLHIVFMYAMSSFMLG
jgi:hypothetical protein